MLEFLKPYAGEILSVFVTGFGAWIFQRKKQKTEVNTNEIENAEKGLQYYRQMVDDLGSRLTQTISLLHQTLEELNKARLELVGTRLIIKELETKVGLLTEELKKYKQLNGKLE